MAELDYYNQLVQLEKTRADASELVLGLERGFDAQGQAAYRVAVAPRERNRPSNRPSPLWPAVWWQPSRLRLTGLVTAEGENR